MHRFEILIGESAIRSGAGPFLSANQLLYSIPESAEELLDPILSPYGENPTWYFEKLNHGRPPAPWAIVCLDREYALAGHVTQSRPADAGIAFTYYRRPRMPFPDDFVPAVGTLVFFSKSGLESAVGNSPLFASAWDALRDASEEQNWLVLLDPPDADWLAQVEPGDGERWLRLRR